MQAAQERSERQGVGVSMEGQQLFDCFYKTMPCKWQGKTILVLGEVHPISLSVHGTACEYANMMARLITLTHSHPTQSIFAMQVKIKEPYNMSCVNKAHPDVPSVVLDRVVKMVRTLLTCL